MKDFLLTVLGIGLMILFFIEDYNNKKRTRLQQLQQMQEYQRKQIWQMLGEAVVATECQYFHIPGITLEEICMDGTDYIYQGFAYLHVQSIFDDIDKRSYYMKLRRNIAKSLGCKVNQIPYTIKVYNDYVDIIVKVC